MTSLGAIHGAHLRTSFFQPALGPLRSTTSKQLQNFKLLCESCDYCLKQHLCFSYPEALCCKLISSSLLPTCSSLSLWQLYLFVNFHPCRCSWLGLHQSRHTALPETKQQPRLISRVNSKHDSMMTGETTLPQSLFPLQTCSLTKLTFGDAALKNNSDWICKSRHWVRYFI